MKLAKRLIVPTFILGAVAYSFQFGVGLGHLTAPQPTPYPTYQEIRQNQLDITKSLEDSQPHHIEKTPCLNPIGQNESDLCAQYRAANSAYESARWAKFQFWLSLIGAIGLIGTIILTVRATNAAIQANKISHETAARQLRAYVFSPGLEWEIRTSLPQDGFHMVIWSTWRNMGHTPTRDLQIYFTHRVIDASVPCFGIGIEPDGSEELRYQLGPGQQVRSPPASLDASTLDAIYKGESNLFVAGLARYRDAITNEAWETRVCYRVTLFRDRTKPLEGDNFSYMEWHVVGPHNCADEECRECLSRSTKISTSP